MAKTLAPLSVDLREAVVTACAQAFHYKDTLRAVFVNAGVPGARFDALRSQELSKPVIARAILSELDAQGVAGRRAQHAVVHELCRMQRPAADAPDPKAGADALAAVRRLAKTTGLTGLVDDDAQALAARRKRQQQARAARQAEAQRQRDLQSRFADLCARQPGITAQQRGYAFEAFLTDLFRNEDIEYRPPYRISSVEQIDGAFKLEGLDYLVEARWRSDPPDLGDFLELAGKLEGKLMSTRGLFITMRTPRPEVVSALAVHTKRVVIMDGADLSAVLEGMTLRDALEIKIRKAAQEGVIFHQLRRTAAA